jgi:hypothetical protein
VREYANPHSRRTTRVSPGGGARTRSTVESNARRHVSGTAELIISRHNLEEASASERTHVSADVQLARPGGGDGGGRGASRACSLLRVGTETELLFAAARQRRRRRCGGFEPRASLPEKVLPPRSGRRRKYFSLSLLSARRVILSRAGRSPQELLAKNKRRRRCRVIGKRLFVLRAVPAFLHLQRE